MIQLGQCVDQSLDLALVLADGGDEHAGVAARQSLADGLRAEGREQWAEHGPQLECAEEHRVQLQTAASQPEHPFARGQAQGVQQVGKAAALLLEGGVGEVVDPVVAAEQPHRHAFGERAARVTVHGLVGDVQAAAGQAGQLGPHRVPGKPGAGGGVIDQVGPHRQEGHVFAHRGKLHGRLRERVSLPAAQPGAGRNSACVMIRVARRPDNRKKITIL